MMILLLVWQERVKQALFFWNRYKNYLLSIKSWPVEVIQRIDKLQKKMLEFFREIRKASEPFDRRGLIFRYVSIGKQTCKFLRGNNKAYDLGIKLVIVLSGQCTTIYESQRKFRLEKEVLDLFWYWIWKILEG